MPTRRGRGRGNRIIEVEPPRPLVDPRQGEFHFRNYEDTPRINPFTQIQDVAPFANMGPDLSKPQVNWFEPQPIISFIVGTEPLVNTFQVHKSAVCQLSPMIAAAFNGPFSETQIKTMSFPDVELAIFGAFLSYVYTGAVEGGSRYLSLVELVKVWVFAERILCRTLQDCVTKALYFRPLLLLPTSSMIKVSNLDTIEYIWSDKNPVEGLKEMFLDKIICHTSQKTFKEIAATLPPAVVLEVALASLAKKDTVCGAGNTMTIGSMKKVEHYLSKPLTDRISRTAPFDEEKSTSDDLAVSNSSQDL